MSEAARKPSTSRRVLIVEDERAICNVLTEMVEDDGFEPHCVQTDLEAFDALRRHRFACMIVDVNLGAGTTGYDVARFGRRLAPQLPVIYVSGQTSEASYRANGVPGSLFLPKPFTAAELLARVHKLVGDND